MKTYKTHSGCMRANGSAYPIHVYEPRRTEWVPAESLFDLGEVLAEAVFTAGGDLKHDRIFRLRRLPCGAVAMQTELSRGYPPDWPQLHLYDDLSSAMKAFEATAMRYMQDSRWSPVARPCNA